MSESDFDPRFDPAFQPGYDPTKHAAQTRPRVSPEHQTQQQDDYVPAVVDVTPRATPVEEPIAVVRTANPLLVALWVLSVLFVAAGVYGLRLIGDRVAALGANGGFGGADYYLLQAYTIGAPLLIVLGLATATGTLFLLAARWRRVPAE